MKENFLNSKVEVGFGIGIPGKYLTIILYIGSNSKIYVLFTV